MSEEIVPAADGFMIKRKVNLLYCASQMTCHVLKLKSLTRVNISTPLRIGSEGQKKNKQYQNRSQNHVFNSDLNHFVYLRLYVANPIDNVTFAT